MRRGLVLGKFMPPHSGHVFLVEFAKSYADAVTVVVGSLAAEPIPGALRARWMRELFPEVEVLHLTDENPQSPDEAPSEGIFWEIWRTSLLRILGAPPALVFASEGYGRRLAAELGAEFVPVDPGREALRISGTALRGDPWRHWAHLPRCVRPHFLRRVSVFGPESCGKTTLCRDLAPRFGGVWAPEYARTWLEEQPDPTVSPEGLRAIVRGQVATEEALARAAERALICDTDPLLTAVWSEALFGAVDPWIVAAAGERRYDLTLLVDVDVPWEVDPVRYLGDAGRAGFYERCEAILRAHGRPFVRIRGSRSERLAAATAAIEGLGAPGGGC